MVSHFLDFLEIALLMYGRETWTVGRLHFAACVMFRAVRSLLEGVITWENQLSYRYWSHVCVDELLHTLLAILIPKSRSNTRKRPFARKHSHSAQWGHPATSIVFLGYGAVILSLIPFLCQGSTLPRRSIFTVTASH